MIRVYIDQVQCTGSMVCESIASQVFAMDDEGLATVLENGVALPDGGAARGGDDGAACGAAVQPDQVGLVRDASAACPGGCIHVVGD
jgi:ferredoxin